MYLITESLQIIETFTTLNVRQLPMDWIRELCSQLCRAVMILFCIAWHLLKAPTFQLLWLFYFVPLPESLCVIMLWAGSFSIVIFAAILSKEKDPCDDSYTNYDKTAQDTSDDGTNWSALRRFGCRRTVCRFTGGTF